MGKRTRLTFCLILMHGIQAASLVSQVTRITGASESLDSIRITFEDLTVGVRAENTYASLGVGFEGESKTTPTTSLWDAGHGWSADMSLKNVGEEIVQRDSALIIRFRYPVSEVTLGLVNGFQDTVATIQGYAPNGELLGEIEKGGIDENNPVSLRLDTFNIVGMARVVLDYGDDAAEQITSLRFKYAEPRIFRSYIAQIGSGQAAKNLSLQTVLQFQGLMERQESWVVLKLFDPSGQPLELSLSGKQDSSFEFPLMGRGVRRMATDAVNGELAVGYVSIESTLPIAAQSTLTTLGPNDLPLQEASIAATEGSPTVSIPVERNPATGLNTGFAMVNLGDKESLVILLLTNETGEKPEEVGNAPDFLLQPGEHRAVFLTEVYEFLAVTPFVGSLTILSQEPVAVASLRTYKGVAWSSLPVGSTQR